MATEAYVSDRFVVLKRLPFKDSDAHLVLLGQRLGKCVALAKGVGKPASKLSSLLDVANLIEAELYDGKAGYTLLSASQEGSFRRRFQSYAALLSSVTLCETADAALESGPGVEDFFALLVAALAAMDDRNPVEVRLRFDWALLQWSGYASADPAELAALLVQFCRGDIRQTTIDELLAFFSVPLDAPYAKEFLLSKTARKTMRQLLDKLLATHLSLRLKSTELLDAATVQFYP